MNPEKAVYIANFGQDGFYFRWADFNNEPINDWKKLESTFLSTPIAHQHIGFTQLLTMPNKKR